MAGILRRQAELAKEQRLAREAEKTKNQMFIDANPKPPLAPKDAPSGKIPDGIAFGTRRGIGGKSRKRKIGKTRRNRRLKKK